MARVANEPSPNPALTEAESSVLEMLRQQLLQLHDLKCHADGTARPAPEDFAILPQDAFGVKLRTSLLFVHQLKMILPAYRRLLELAMRMDRQGDIRPQAGEAYAAVALDYLLSLYPDGRLHDA